MPRYRTLITSLLVVVSVAAVVGVLRPAFAADLTPPPISAIQFTPEITIPGLLDGTITISPTSIAEYIKVIFIYFIISQICQYGFY